jgi:hypothetical protein
MPSNFTSLFAGSPAAALMEVFAERDANGNFGGVKYRLPSHPEGVEPYLLPGIPSSVRAVTQLTIDGEVRQETKTWQIERTRLDAINVKHPQRNAGIEDVDGAWTVNADECVWGDVFVTLALIRKPRTAGNELRSAAV